MLGFLASCVGWGAVADLLVDVEGLAALSGGLRSSVAGLDGTRGMVDAVGSAVGSSDVLDALEGFERHWRDGREQIRKNVDACSDALDEAARAYRDTDEQLAHGLRERTTTTHVVQGAS